MKNIIIIMACCLAAFTSCTEDLTVTRYTTDGYDYVEIKTEETRVSLPYSELDELEYSLNNSRFEEDIRGGRDTNHNNHLKVEFKDNNKTAVITFWQYDDMFADKNVVSYLSDLHQRASKDKHVVTVIETSRKYLLSKIERMNTISE